MDSEDDYIMITYEGRSRLVERPGTQAAAKALAVSEFDLPRRAEVKFAVDWKGRRIEIGKDSFSVVSHVDELFVLATGTREPRTRRPNPTMTPATPYTMQVFVKCWNGRTLAMACRLEDTVRAFKANFVAQAGLDCDDILLVYAGKTLRDDLTLAHSNVCKGCTIDHVLRLRGGKPIIYLQPPGDLENVSVTLGLVREWDFSAVYPVVPSKMIQNRSTIEWNVAAKASGELTEHASGLQLSYLFWEAETNPHRPPTPGDEETAENLFNPANPVVSPDNAVVLSFLPFLKHLDRALTSLGLHVSARNDFVTFWLPHFVRIHESGKDIAFRFLPQAEYEQAARLDVVPTPDVITRVFLLFGGIDPSDLDWAEAYQRAGDVNWKQIVGVRDEAWDSTKFRVLEWGGMDVHRA